VGVLGGIAAIRALKAAGFEPRRSIDIIMFTSEEPTRFGIGCSGSRLLGGASAPAEIAGLTDEEGVTFDQARMAAGYRGSLLDVPLNRDAYAYFVELHVEQGPVLERENLQIGVVTAIAAPASFTVRFEGDGGHAGTVLMPDRRDALVPAAALITLAETLARGSGSADTVATVGMLNVHPGAINSIPRQVTIAFDVRDTDLEVRDRLVAELQSRARSLAQQRGLTCQIQPINSDPPAQADATVLAAIESACNAQGCRFRRMVSRAYHDALFMARVAPMGMIFVPSKDGISHRPEEFTATQDIANGVAVLARTLAQLAA
jgi:N-carbamoyl-L-amino-acid hydrolase